LTTIAWHFIEDNVETHG